MNFQGLAKIEDYKFYLDVAFNAAKREAIKSREETREEHITDRMKKSKFIEIEKIKCIEKTLSNHLLTIVKKFPKIEELPDFYKELMHTLFKVEQLRKSLSSVNFVIVKTKELSHLYTQKIRSSKTIEDMNTHRRQYYGRISSLLKEIREDLQNLEFARKEMKSFPAVKTNIPSVCICGFPNVGKSTLLNKITGSNAEIQSYAFTTKSLLIGYANSGYGKIQFIDSPGVLNRAEKENFIEHQAYLAVKHLAKCCVFVLDLTETGGYTVSEQLKLLTDLRKLFEKTFLVYLSKTDLMTDSTASDFIKSKNYPVFTDYSLLMKEIEKHIEQTIN